MNASSGWHGREVLETHVITVVPEIGTIIMQTAWEHTSKPSRTMRFANTAQYVTAHSLDSKNHVYNKKIGSTYD